MMKEEKLKQLKMALTQHKPLVLDLGDDIVLYPVWNEEKQMYQDEMGYTTMETLIEIAKGKNKKIDLKIFETK